MDEADYGSLREQTMTAYHLDEARRKATTQEVEVTGLCAWCKDQVSEGLRFCPPESPGVESCRDSWQRYQKAMKRNGACE